MPFDLSSRMQGQYFKAGRIRICDKESPTEVLVKILNPIGLSNEIKVQGGQHYFWRIHYLSYARNRIIDEALHVQTEKRKMNKRRKRRWRKIPWYNNNNNNNTLEKSPSKGANNSSASREFHAFYGIQNFIRPVVFVKAYHLSQSWPIKYSPRFPVQFLGHPF